MFTFADEFFLMSPDELGGAGGGAAPVDPGQAAAAPTGGDSAAAAAAAAAQQQTSTQPAAGQQQQAAAALIPLHEAIRQQGFGLPEHINDARGALEYLLQQARQVPQLQQYAEYGRAVAPQWQQYQAWLQQQTGQQQATKKGWHDAPEFNAGWASMITRDEKGNLVPLPGAPPDVVQKYMNAMRHREEFLGKFAQDPMGAIKPGLEEFVRAEALKIVQQSMGGYQENQFANGFLQQHSGWIYQADGSGQQIRDVMTGQPMLTPAGRVFTQHLQAAVQMGIPSEQARAQYAFNLTRAQFMAQQNPAGTAAQQNQQQKQNFLNGAGGANRMAGAGGSLAALNGGAPAGGLPQNAKLSLSDQLRQALAAGGVTDAAVNQTLQGVN